MCLPPPKYVKKAFFQIPPSFQRPYSLSSFSGVSQEVDWWITSRCHYGGLVTISEMMVSACLHVSVIDSPNPKHSPLPTSQVGTLDWNHSRWGGVWAICYLLLACFTTAPPLTPYQHPPPPNPRTHSAPAARIFTTRTHYGNQTVCVYRNQSREKAIVRVMTRWNLFGTFDECAHSPDFFSPLGEKDRNADVVGYDETVTNVFLETNVAPTIAN